ncbi:17430_t:CDS:2 [Acaulospora morrowiae]|uniref:17430_t:CDS:1 n=1 Tax=Acaulospora morrowiae TaxID=94023 RepID=A0A9N8VUB1_9GLOM|nr:17430_t:CDS:2 [Acaulospora morrowiae]
MLSSGEKITEKTKEEYCKIHVWGVDSPWNSTNTTNGDNNLRQQQTSNNIESEINTGITVVPFKCCPNQRRIQKMQASLGKLLRIGTLAGTTWTTENPKTPCHLILPDNHSVGEENSSSVSQMTKSGGGDELHGCSNNPNNPLMIVEKIASESDCRRAASFIGTEIKSEVPPDPMNLLLWPLGDYFKGIVDEFNTDQVAWGAADDGSVFEVENYELDKHNTHPFPKKGKKSKSSKKKKHH